VGVLLSILGLLFLAGCGHSDVPQIDEYTWAMTTVQDTEEDGRIIAYGPGGSSAFDNAVEADLECAAKDGELSLIDKAAGRTYAGSYTRLSADSKSSVYEVTVDNVEGTAVSALTTYHDGDETPTLIISLGAYTLNFFAE